MRKKWKEVTDEWPLCNCGCGVPGWGMQYDEFLTKLWRDQLPPHEPCAGCKLGSGVMEDNLHMLIFISPETARVPLLATAEQVKNMSLRACRHGVQKLLKIRTEF